MLLTNGVQQRDEAIGKGKGRVWGAEGSQQHIRVFKSPMRMRGSLRFANTGHTRSQRTSTGADVFRVRVCVHRCVY